MAGSARRAAIAISAVVGGAVFLRKKAKQQQAEQDLWTQATDDVQAPVAPGPAAPSANGQATTSN